MEQHRLSQIILPEYIASAEGCGACEYKLRQNTPEERASKQQCLQNMLLEAAKETLDVERMLTGPLHEIFPAGKPVSISLIGTDSRFDDLEDAPQGALVAIQRLAWLSQAYHPVHGEKHLTEEEKTRFLQAVAHYCKVEADRTDLGRSRFHTSIFCFPKCAVQLFHVFLPEFLAVERGETQDRAAEEARWQLLRICMQAWTLPQRGDHTDLHPISPERFRKHVWWVGANAICYRPLFAIALVFRQVEMMDTLMFVASHILTPVSAATVDEAFWSEGICADGFGWGHGRQTYNTGYPTQGILSGLDILAALTGTPWEEALRELDFTWLLRYMRGITWGDYNGWNAPMQSRHCFKRGDNVHAQFNGTEYALQIAAILREHFFHLLNQNEREEVEAFLKTGRSPVPGYPASQYEGVRYFWNNDDLICKKNNCYWFVNMASSRSDGVECAFEMADKRNAFLADGSYVVARRGDEYREAMGTWQMGMLPGITSRELANEELVPETNWRGYHSKFGFAGGAVRGGCGVAGFIFEKKRTEEPEAEEQYTKEMMGVRAYKSYFILHDTLVCLGAGIRDVKPEYGHMIRTAINHTGWNTDAVLMDGNGTVLERVEGKRILPLDQVYAIAQDGILYGVLPADGPHAQLEICAEVRRTDWQALNAGNTENDDADVPVFTLSLLHGEKVQDAGYAYWMYCGEQQPAAYLKTRPVHILQNTAEVQAVETQDGSILQAVLYKAGAVCRGTKWHIQTDCPAVLMLEEADNTLQLTVCDPQQDPARKTLEVSIQMEGNPVRRVRAGLPDGVEAGKPITICLENR